MKKTIAMICCLFLLIPSAVSEIQLAYSPAIRESVAAALARGAVDAYLSPSDARLYCLSAVASGYEAAVYDSAAADPKAVMNFGADASYLSIRADADGNILLLRRDADETKKSGILRLIEENEKYAVTEYLFPAATSALSPERMDFSPFSSSGCLLMKLAGEEQSVSALCVFNVFWGVLQGYDELVVIEPGATCAKSVPMADLYDAYGYAADGAKELIGKISSGELLSPIDASMSPDGDMVLFTADYQGETLLYIMDVYSLDLELVYPPDHFSGTIGWTETSMLSAVSDAGETFEVAFQGFGGGEWNGNLDEGWASGGDGDWGDAPVDSWEESGEKSLSDWS